MSTARNFAILACQIALATTSIAQEKNTEHTMHC